MKLIELNSNHYVVVDDSEINTGDIVAEKLNTGKYELFEIQTPNDIDVSSQELVIYTTDINDNERYYIPLSEAKELIGKVDVKKKAEVYSSSKPPMFKDGMSAGYEDGYHECLEDNKEKKYTEEDLEAAACFGMVLEKFKDDKYKLTNDEEWKGFLQSLQPKTEWEVELDSNGKFKLKRQPF